MKRSNLKSLALLSTVLIVPGYADKVQLDQLPRSVQDKIRAQTGSAQVEDIDREVRNGKTIYEVAFKRNGQNTEIQVEDDSQTSTAQATSSTTLDSRKISFNEVPENVRRAARLYLRGAEVNDVDRQVRDGKVTYEIGFKHEGSAQQELVIAQDGSVIRAPASTPIVNKNNNPGNVINSSPTVAGSSTASSVHSRTMQFDDLPGNVRKVAQANLQNGHVERVTRLTQNGDISYELLFRRDNGQYQQFVVSDEGRIIRNDSVSNPTAVGSSATTQSSSSSGNVNTGQAAEYANITSPIMLRNAIEIDRGELPINARKVVRQQTRNDSVEKVLRGEWNGKQVYQVSFNDQNNQRVELQMDGAGNIIYDPRTAPKQSTTGNLLNNIGRLLDRQQ